jgi:probable HAF family extracellular repeat protein
MSRYRIHSPVLAAAVLLAFALPLTAQAQSYNVVDLGSIVPTAINNNGEMVGDGFPLPDPPGCFGYTYGAPGDGLTFLEGVLSVGAINLSGVAAGQAYNSYYGRYVGCYTSPITRAGGIGGSASILGMTGASGINDAGEVVGYAFLGNSGPTVARSYLSGSLTTLPMPPGAVDSYATSVNNSGEIVGWADGYSGASENHAFAYSDGNTADLNDMIPPNSGLILTGALAVNNSGWIIGTALTVSNAGVGGFLLEGSNLIDFGPGFGANGINSAGEVVGSDGAGAALYDNGVTTNLNTLLPADSGWTLQTATAINDNGWIVGSGLNPSSQDDGFLLIPTPEPTALATLTIGAGLALARRRNLTMPIATH